MHPEPADWLHFTIEVRSLDEAACKRGIESMIQMFCGGRCAYHRHEPEINRYTDFVAENKNYKGVAVFTIRAIGGTKLVTGPI